jgi:23S rRNA pseudouridine955/2504/2580 synthase
MKRSRTAYRFLAGKDGFSLLELEPGTGRMHQIRRHLALIGHPILGDDKYGDFALNRELRKTRGLRRLLLHAHRLRIDGEGFSLDVTAPLPDYFAGFPGG